MTWLIPPISALLYRLDGIVEKVKVEMKRPK